MEQEWSVVYTTNKIYEAEILKNVFSENNIECISMNKMDSSYLLGEIEVMVPKEQITEAEKLILLFDIE